MDIIVSALRGADIFRGLSPLQLTEIARNADRVVFKPGDVILERDEVCEEATLIFDGEAVCLRGAFDPAGDETVGPGAVLAEMAMVVDIEPSATVVAKSKVRALRITRAAILAQIADDPSLGECLIDVITGRLRNVAAHLRQIENDLATEAANQPGSDGLSGRGVPPTPASHTEMAMLH